MLQTNEINYKIDLAVKKKDGKRCHVFEFSSIINKS